ncbi:Conserved hypothetical protein [Clostridium acetobutylicum EA 2018]|uniref:Uncharacterized protein n=1 Tax=Clostridium acetobutylicum (strain ATCC 824 / DSM 792 / JCM 1419 / IAM 19013 / LMG 5710 / NBRC 13948 / NRRL B-527 / VKM B-1787 / 2291 / W) TaxID=272562 RepID=Q97LD8_CLOAB|nr:Hypothetical protein CA_C0624 [Clostridium acetobutylicum ATCC 824]ADZ19674.1 Conserved hypothetical protein [Clostridium acetobutylicum EA 2018]AEI31344.1 hypothetical protein SMB_G0638 [Clostridium acetobutylicum DSM 1731]AWV80325.1 hypothetical protein DK921_09495 [Clostridium acetobutylicum]PSM06127.1 hypothetical protein C7T89_09490 [Clostridium sp. NJ4]
MSSKINSSSHSFIDIWNIYIMPNINNLIHILNKFYSFFLYYLIFYFIKLYFQFNKIMVKKQKIKSYYCKHAFI